ncbi:hypothetical protein SISNIDRAFT_483886 [Sistotremastrum niveocremeum HHB9708]|uniref:DUF6533 domain-containing protein n=1 Tax=Sistotremastrum niveocremeum HHB9708 TaxID=1314777 RepID=A0A164X5Y0_9AGAM|nr:hypothetical protein SISNIDRAFT_483886 [Sistotremastrum niveocremeum HHB9708]
MSPSEVLAARFSVAGTFLILWDILINLSNEVVLFWAQPRRPSDFLYLSARYGGLFVQALSIPLLLPSLNTALSISISLSPNSCLALFRAHQVLIQLLILNVDIILLVKLCKSPPRNNTTLILYSAHALLFVKTLVVLIITCFQLAKRIHILDDASTTATICFDRFNQPLWIGIWLPTVFYELLLCIFLSLGNSGSDLPKRRSMNLEDWIKDSVEEIWRDGRWIVGAIIVGTVMNMHPTKGGLSWTYPFVITVLSIAGSHIALCLSTPCDSTTITITDFSNPRRSSIQPSSAAKAARRRSQSLSFVARNKSTTPPRTRPHFRSQSSVTSIGTGEGTEFELEDRKSAIPPQQAGQGAGETVIDLDDYSSSDASSGNARREVMNKRASKRTSHGGGLLARNGYFDATGVPPPGPTSALRSSVAVPPLPPPSRASTTMPAHGPNSTPPSAMLTSRAGARSATPGGGGISDTETIDDTASVNLGVGLPRLSLVESRTEFVVRKGEVLNVPDNGDWMGMRHAS